MARAALIVGGVAYLITISVVIVAGVGVGTVVFTPLYLLLVPYGQLGKGVVSSEWKTSSIALFALTVLLMLGSLVFIFRR